MMDIMSSSDDFSSHWVFGYGSLIWRPGFPFLSAQKARMQGVHRRLCIVSVHHRGTVERPGLVFGLERGGSCVGVAYQVSPEDWESVQDYLREREQVTTVYRETVRPVHLEDGGRARALTYVADPTHEQYAGRLSVDEQARRVREAVGGSGANRDYVINTATHLAQMGIIDRQLAMLSALLED